MPTGDVNLHVVWRRLPGLRADLRMHVLAALMSLGLGLVERGSCEYGTVSRLRSKVVALQDIKEWVESFG